MYIRPHELPQTLFHVLAEGSWDYCRSVKVVSQHARINCKMMRLPVAETNKGGLVGLNLDRIYIQSSINDHCALVCQGWVTAICAGSDHSPQIHPSQKGSVGIEGISPNCPWKMLPLEPGNAVSSQCLRNTAAKKELLLRVASEVVKTIWDKNRKCFTHLRLDI